MTESNVRWKARVRKLLEPVLDEETTNKVIAALEPEFQQKGMSAGTADLLGMNDPALNAKLKAEDEMCKRVEAALKIAPSWDSRKDPWGGYHIKLVAKEKETGFTIEQFVKWWNSDDFRKKQGLWLNPDKINRFWPTAMSETDTHQEPQEWQDEDWRNAELG